MPRLENFSGWPAALIACLAFGGAILPTLHRLEFFDGVEHFNLATVQEMKRDGGDWLLPKLQGEPRVVKPPLTAWLTAALVPAEVVERLSDADPTRRAAAFDRFVFLARLPTLACACLMLLGVYELGRVLAGGDRRVGLVSLLVCAGCLLFLQQGRRATTDLQLAVWVTWTNALLAKAVFERRHWVGCVGGGLTLGLAMMAKGPPIALLQTIVPLAPLALLAPIGRWMLPATGALLSRTARHPRSSYMPGVPRAPENDSLGNGGAATTSPSESARNASRQRWIVPTLAGVAVAAVVGCWWYAYVLGVNPAVWETWIREVTRRDAQIGRNVMRPDRWYAYTSLFGLLLPWTAWALLGAGHTLWDAAGRTSRAASPILLATLLAVIPILVMSLFGEKKDRYLTPFVGPAAVLAAYAIVRHWDSARPMQDAGRRKLTPAVIAASFTWAATAWLVVGVPIAGAIGMKGYVKGNGQPWFGAGEAAVFATGGVLLLILALFTARRLRLIPVIAVVLAMWIGSEARLRGSHSSPGDADDRPQRRLADRIWAEVPTATVYSADPPALYGQLNRAAIVLSMHLNRVVLPRPTALPATAGERPLILITDIVGDPPPVPTGWTRWEELPLRKGKRYVDVLR